MNKVPLIAKEKLLNYWNPSTSGIHKVFDDGSGARLRGGPMQDSEELWWLLKRIEENINEFGQITSILELGVADGGGMKVWEQVLLSEANVSHKTKNKNTKELLTYIGIDFKPNPLWDISSSPIDIRLIFGSTHEYITRSELKSILRKKNIDKVDFLWIDAQHWSNDVKQDFEDYGEFVKDNRMICFHDTRLCRSFWDEFTVNSKDSSRPDNKYGEEEDKVEKMVFHKEEYKNSLGTGIFYKLPNQNVVKFKE